MKNILRRCCILKGGKRLDYYVSGLFRSLSRSEIQKVILVKRACTVNNTTCTQVSKKLRKGDVLSVSLLHTSTEGLLPRNDITLDILYEDPYCMVINKQAGLTVHPGDDDESKNMSLVHALLALPGFEQHFEDHVRPGIVHRIDKWTSGALLVAKSAAVQEYYQEQFKKRAIKKIYIALVHGTPKNEHGIIDAPIGRDSKHRKQLSITPGGKDAQTEYTVIEERGQYSLIKIRLHTGRTHQIRVHMASIGHPLVGDTVYGPKKQHFTSLAGQCLHAWQLSFPLYQKECIETITAPLPEEFKQLLESLDFTYEFGLNEDI